MSKQNAKNNADVAARIDPLNTARDLRTAYVASLIGRWAENVHARLTSVSRARIEQKRRLVSR